MHELTRVTTNRLENLKAFPRTWRNTPDRFGSKPTFESNRLTDPLYVFERVFCYVFFLIFLL